MRWLIVEDSLESRKGHWFEYVQGFCLDLPKLGDEVILLSSRQAEPFIISHLNAEPVLPESVYLKLSDGAPAFRRNLRIPVHAIRTFWAMRHFLKTSSKLDIIFVPTTTVHHLLGWFGLVKTVLRLRKVKLLLFFPGLPINHREGGTGLDGSATSKLFQPLLRGLSPEIFQGKVILGVETEAMKVAAEAAFRVPFSYFPHPVIPSRENGANPGLNSKPITFGSYGPARHEKGSDILVTAIEVHLRQFPESTTKFVIQWLEDFYLPDGAIAKLPAIIRGHPRVEIIDRFFDDGEYARRLEKTDVMLLPYRRTSYGLRLSRVVAEAMVCGIPVVVNRGTTLATQAEQFGAPVFCEDGNVESLIAAIEKTEHDFESLTAKAQKRKTTAAEHFSVREFRQQLLTSQNP